MSTKSPHRLLLRLSIFIFFLAVGFIIIRQQKTTLKLVNIRAAIIPHHLVAQELMVDLGNRLSPQKIPHIIIIGPNHFELGGRHLLTDNFSLNQGSLIFNSDIVNQDHACNTPRTILQKILPDTKFSCILISTRVTSTEISFLSSYLKNILGPQDVLIASVDFSHYLPMRQAQENDQITWNYLSKFDTVSLLKLKDHFLDSPQTISLLFNYLHQINILNYTKINNLNSAQILNIPDLASTTSYFEIVYY